ncbi:hypothetical protein NL30_36310 [Burkholderia contaminans]|uniref:hypothetical protein n=1 Tax=Burkholderia contaminans TaxID=488447 RepID=UPI00064A216C|nr:hypothetical protein [Burkholderia contaminans]AKM45308.1 hypothetical protein NL30_36310 [Burkholderia contaminans]
MTTPDPERPTIDLAEPDGARYLLLHDDFFVRERFAAPLALKIDDMADALAACFKRLRPLMTATRESRAPRTDLLTAFVIGALDDLAVSTKLLLTGKLAASGNVARQAIEGVAMAMLCSVERELVIEQRPRQGNRLGRYWELLLANDRVVEGQHAVRQLRWNAELIGAAEPWIDLLAVGQKRLSGVSHAGPLAIATRTSLSGTGPIVFGGQFDPEKDSMYRVEMEYRIALCRQLAQVMDHLLGTMTGAVAA